MNSQEQILVCSRADDICSAPEPERPEGCILQTICSQDLDGDDEENEVFCEGLWPAELGYLSPPFVRICRLRKYRNCEGREGHLLQDAL